MDAPALDARLGDRLRRVRIQTGLSQDELARRLTTDDTPWASTKVGKIERGEQTITGVELLALAAVLTAGSVDALVAEITLEPSASGRRTRRDAWSGRSDATIRAARRLGISPADVDLLALDTFGRTFLAERERRVGSASDDPAEARRQATRTMLQELRGKATK